ncbi:UNVERIFIED_CONTAM: G1/S-specific cyclin-E1 [Siphonaria sp. JEL0065]|nr:G1/S-specific cyclin-E1 [Siphonaria sp. JEL0065]
MSAPSGQFTFSHSTTSTPRPGFSPVSSRTCSPAFAFLESGSRSNSPSIEMSHTSNVAVTREMQARPDRSAHLEFKRLASDLDVTSRANIVMHLNKIKKMQALEDKHVMLPIPALLQNPALNQRTIMICSQWLSESCAIKGFGRSTYHLAVSNLFTYLMKHNCVQLEDFQMVGAAMLHCATKLEECDDFAFSIILAPNNGQGQAEDGQSEEPSIEELEADLLKSSNEMMSFDDSLLFETSSPIRIVTAYDWLMVYRQNYGYYCNLKESLTHPVDFDYYGDGDKVEYMFQVLDIMITDMEYLKFKYSLLAAGVWYYFNRGDVLDSTLLMVTGYTKAQLSVVFGDVNGVCDTWGLPECDEVCPPCYYHRQALSFVPLDDLVGVVIRVN